MRKLHELADVSLCFGGFFVNRLSCPPAHFCTITEVKLNGSFSQCELIMRQAVIKMFALMVFRVIGGGVLQHTGEIKAGHA